VMEVCTAASPEFSSLCVVWNSFVSRVPVAVLRCTSVEGVCDAVRHATKQGWDVAVRGGGHNVSGLALGAKDGAYVIDLSAMRGVHVDTKVQVAVCQGGCLAMDVDAATAPHNLYVAGLGLISTTGIGGLAMGGGVGWLARKYGLAIDNIVSVDLVNANGELLRTVSESHCADLFFGVRGGGSNFGIVVSFTFRLVSVPYVAVRTVVFDTHMDKALSIYGDFVCGAADNITAYGFLSSCDNLLERLVWGV
jgi:FAD/FMN-containing dehydrogenase